MPDLFKSDCKEFLPYGKGNIQASSGETPWVGANGKGNIHMKVDIEVNEDVLNRMESAHKGLDSLRKDVDNALKELKVALSIENSHKKQIVEGHNKLVRQVNRLEATKMTKPSIAQELIDAETYMDDYEAVRKEFRTKRFAQKQRIKKKLKRIEEANKVAEKPNRIKHILITTGLVLVAYAAWALI